MKEIKAYIRTDALEKTVEALKEAKAPGITVTSVHPVGYGFDPNYFTEDRSIIKRYWDITKIEVVCTDNDMERLVEVIRENSFTGSKGDGMIFVTAVERAIRIRSGEEGETAL
jgi:nitrogen regulatory protein P-II 1